MSTPAVRMSGITKTFGDVVANDSVDFEVESGTIHALLGENGAGKTTLMNVLYGLYQQDEGTVEIEGEVRDFDSPRDAIDTGIGMIHQHFMLVDPMTVAENVVMGNEPEKYGGIAVDRDAAVEGVREISEKYGFDVDPEARIEDIGVGVQQRVEIIKAIYRGADILILDEPTAVLTPQEVEGLFEVLGEMTAEGKTIIFITHKIGEVMAAADKVTVLRDGKAVGTARIEDVTREEIAEMMVGREVVLETDKEPSTPGEEVLDVRDVAVTDERGVQVVDGVDLSVREGEIFGIAGVDGNGQAELVETITGMRSPDEGTVVIDGEEVTHETRREHIETGMAYVPENRQERGLVMDFDLVENGLLGSQHSPDFTSKSRINWGKARDHAEDVIEEYDVRTSGSNAAAKSLSGGNQQKFIVGRELSREPQLVVASHPTRGVDIGSVEFIHDQLLDMRDAGKAILVVSSKLDEVQTLSDRLAVIYEGEIMDVVDPEAVTEEQLGLLMAGEEPDEVPSIRGKAETEEEEVVRDGGATDAGGDR